MFGRPTWNWWLLVFTCGGILIESLLAVLMRNGTGSDSYVFGTNRQEFVLELIVYED